MKHAVIIAAALLAAPAAAAENPATFEFNQWKLVIKDGYIVLKNGEDDRTPRLSCSSSDGIDLWTFADTPAPQKLGFKCSNGVDFSLTVTRKIAEDGMSSMRVDDPDSSRKLVQFLKEANSDGVECSMTSDRLTPLENGFREASVAFRVACYSQFVAPKRDRLDYLK